MAQAKYRFLRIIILSMCMLGLIIVVTQHSHTKALIADTTEAGRGMFNDFADAASSRFSDTHYENSPSKAFIDFEAPLPHETPADENGSTAWTKEHMIRQDLHPELYNKLYKMEEEKIKRVLEDWDNGKVVVHNRGGKVDAHPEPKGKKIVILTASDGGGHNSEIPDGFNRALSNRQEYADYHGYTNFFVNTTKFELGQRTKHWGKLPAILEAFDTYPEAEWVWMIDVDIVIMDASFDLAAKILNPEAMDKVLLKHFRMKAKDNGYGNTFTPSNPDLSQIDLIISEDAWTLNTGSMFFRRSQWTFDFIDFWFDPAISENNLEQPAMMEMFINHPRMLQHVGLVPQRIINAYRWSDDKIHGWQPGDLLGHIAGCWVSEECGSAFENLWDQRTKVSDLPPLIK